MLTKPQYTALAKWSDGKAAHQKLYRVRDDVYMRLRNAGYLQPAGFMVKAITQAGQAALVEYETAHLEEHSDAEQ